MRSHKASSASTEHRRGLRPTELVYATRQLTIWMSFARHTVTVAPPSWMSSRNSAATSTSRRAIPIFCWTPTHRAPRSNRPWPQACHEGEKVMQTIETQEAAIRKQPRLKLISLAAVAVAVAMAGVWFVTRHQGGAKRASPQTMSSMAEMASPPVSATAAETANTLAEPQIDLATDDLKKAQIHTTHVSNGV